MPLDKFADKAKGAIDKAEDLTDQAKDALKKVEGKTGGNKDDDQTKGSGGRKA